MVAALLQVVPHVPARAARSVDARVLLWLHHHSGGHRLDGLAKTFTMLGSFPWIIAAMVVLMGICIARRRPLDARATVLAVFAANVASAVLKVVFERTRPHLWHTIITEHSWSMPSGHSTASSSIATCAVLLAWSQPRAARSVRVLVTIGAVLYAGAIGWSRLYLGVHWPSDVLAGWTLGTSVTMLTFTLVRRRSLPPTQQPAGDRSLPGPRRRGRS